MITFCKYGMARVGGSRDVGIDCTDFKLNTNKLFYMFENILI